MDNSNSCEKFKMAKFLQNASISSPSEQPRNNKAVESIDKALSGQWAKPVGQEAPVRLSVIHIWAFQNWILNFAFSEIMYQNYVTWLHHDGMG